MIPRGSQILNDLHVRKLSRRRSRSSMELLTTGGVVILVIAVFCKVPPTSVGLTLDIKRWFKVTRTGGRSTTRSARRTDQIRSRARAGSDYATCFLVE